MQIYRYCYWNRYLQTQVRAYHFDVKYPFCRKIMKRKDEFLLQIKLVNVDKNDIVK